MRRRSSSLDDHGSDIKPLFLTILEAWERLVVARYFVVHMRYSRSLFAVKAMALSLD